MILKKNSYSLNSVFLFVVDSLTLVLSIIYYQINHWLIHFWIPIFPICLYTSEKWRCFLFKIFQLETIHHFPMKKSIYIYIYTFNFRYQFSRIPPTNSCFHFGRWLTYGSSCLVGNDDATVHWSYRQSHLRQSSYPSHPEENPTEWILYQKSFI